MDSIRLRLKNPLAIDREFERILPVVRQGGYVPGADHQVTPSTSLESYRYYLGRLKEVMKQAGADSETARCQADKK